MDVITPKNCDISVKKAIQQLKSAIKYDKNKTFAELIITGLTEGSVLFVGADGVISEDNTNLSYNDANDELTVPTLIGKRILIGGVQP